MEISIYLKKHPWIINFSVYHICLMITSMISLLLIYLISATLLYYWCIEVDRFGQLEVFLVPIHFLLLLDYEALLLCISWNILDEVGMLFSCNGNFYHFCFQAGKFSVRLCIWRKYLFSSCFSMHNVRNIKQRLRIFWDFYLWKWSIFSKQCHIWVEQIHPRFLLRINIEKWIAYCVLTKYRKILPLSFHQPL